MSRERRCWLPLRRGAERDVEEAKAGVGVHEAWVTDLCSQPKDPVVHLMPDGVTGAARLGAPLDEPRRELDRPFDEWEAATRRMEAVG
jgi:hypothetical protein